MWHISYAGNFDYEKELGPQDHDNYSCSCVPHDMEIRMPVSPEFSLNFSEDFEYLQDGFYCYHYMNCINNNEYLVEVTDFAVYINVGTETVDMCVI